MLSRRCRDHRFDGDVALEGDLRLQVAEIIRSERQTMTSGWIPRLRSSVTECWVGLVFCSPEGRGRARGSDVRSRRSPARRPGGNWRMASMKGTISMSPTVPPISTHDHVDVDGCPGA